MVAAEVAIELVVWDKARALRSPVAAEEVAAILADGAPLYQGLVAAIHGGEAGEGEREASEEWLERSRAARLRLGEQLPVVPKKRIKLDPADQERIDRAHPERTFSGEGASVLAAAGDPELEALLAAALEDVRAGRAEEAERALRRFLSERS
jgi:hypothetical protein